MLTMSEKKFTVLQTNNACGVLHEGTRGIRGFTDDGKYIFDIIEKYDIDIMRVARLKGKYFWMASIEFNNQTTAYKHCHYKHENLGMAVLGAYITKEGFKP